MKVRALWVAPLLTVGLAACTTSVKEAAPAATTVGSTNAAIASGQKAALNAQAAAAAAAGATVPTSTSSTSTIPSSAVTCPRAPFVLPTNPTQLKPRAALVDPTTAAKNGAYRTLGVAKSVVVAAGAMHSDIVLVRGVSNNDFAVSVYSHGPAPLQQLSVLGQVAYLYPGTDLPDQGLVGRVPFAAGPNRVADACSRWELRASGSGGLDTSQLAAYARGMRSSR